MVCKQTDLLIRTPGEDTHILVVCTSLAAVTEQLDEDVSCKRLPLVAFLHLTFGLTRLMGRPSLPLPSRVPVHLQCRWRLARCRGCSLPARLLEHAQHISPG